LIRTYPTANSGADAGLFDTEYSWGENAAVYGSLVDYWALTGDSQYNAKTQKAISAQAGPKQNFLPSSRPFEAGNSDQAMWALTALSAAEANFPATASVGYLGLAKGVFDQQVARWDNSTCAGGLRAELTPGTDKDTASIGTFFQLAARLAHETKNSTYTQWATRAYDWASSVGLLNSQTYSVYEETNTRTNCSAESLQQTQWSANAGTFLYGSALMFNVVRLSLAIL
jgi:mannan endo-1,6-alpha-mannosidase